MRRTPAVPNIPKAAAVAATYLGTVVGAGFASGQEVLQFFTAFGASGTSGIALAAALFALFGLAALRLGALTGAASHRALAAAGGRWLGPLIDGLITVFLFGTLSTMLAGAGAVLREEWGVPSMVGNLALLVATVGTVWLGLNGVIGAMVAVTPLLVTATVGISSAVLWRDGPGAGAGAVGLVEPPVPWWPVSALLYVSYNIAGAAAVLVPLGGAGLKAGERLKGAVIGALGLGVAALSIHLALLATLPASAAYEVPMVHIAGLVEPRAAAAYSLVLLAEIYTTALAGLYGLAARLSGGANRRGLPLGFRGTTLVLGLTALLAAQMGFATLVGTFYPLAGLLGIVLLAVLLGSLVSKPCR